MNVKPVIFLAFANDHSSYLQALKKERISIPQELQPLVDERLCELVVEPDATVDDVFRVFNQFKDRIAIFHYAGHSEAEGLHLETEGIVNQLANATGLAQLFGLQQNLQLVFLNGCANNAQVNLLQQQGVKNIIATNTLINDDAAVNFASAFYQAIGSKTTLETAFANAEAYMQTTSGSSDMRALVWKSKPENTSQNLPWEKYFTNPNWSIIQAGVFYGEKPKVPIFIANHPTDLECVKEMTKHLSLLSRAGQISIFDSAQIAAGEEPDKELKRQLLNAAIILLVISPDFLFSPETQEIEEIATQRHRAKTATVIPIFFKETDVRGDNITIPDYYPDFVRLKGLPDEHQKWFISQWADKDAAYTLIARKLRELIEKYRK